MEEVKKFFDKEYRTLVNRVKKRAGSPENAEDVVQEAFTRACQYLNSFDPNKKEFGAWFNTILNNALRDFKRDEMNYGMGMEFNEEESEGVEFRVTDKETSNEIRKEIKKKGALSREILHLYFNLDYTPKDIQKATSFPKGTILSTITRFKNEMKEKYDQSLRRGLGSQRAVT